MPKSDFWKFDSWDGIIDWNRNWTKDIDEESERVRSMSKSELFAFINDLGEFSN